MRFLCVVLQLLELSFGSNRCALDNLNTNDYSLEANCDRQIGGGKKSLIGARATALPKKLGLSWTKLSSNWNWNWIYLIQHLSDLVYQERMLMFILTATNTAQHRALVANISNYLPPPASLAIPRHPAITWHLKSLQTATKQPLAIHLLPYIYIWSISNLEYTCLINYCVILESLLKILSPT